MNMYRIESLLPRGNPLPFQNPSKSLPLRLLRFAPLALMQRIPSAFSQRRFLLQVPFPFVTTRLSFRCRIADSQSRHHLGFGLPSGLSHLLNGHMPYPFTGYIVPAA
ncbi:hypothetical protein AV654_02955 [Paenibacillus elgii]|uniref:Uncharacterized protein n=1 Tax=Paenibacillus elgii TaxID=189691 RepID=A0A165QUN1_9BACL|nr:hypothetical protein AV654_02955 [Paenibacillus elgii]